MGKTPYLFRRKNVYYFRIRIPLEHQEASKSREIVHSLKTENRAEAIPQALKLGANFKALIQDLKAGKRETISRSELIASVSNPGTPQNNQIEANPPLPSTLKQIAFCSRAEITNTPLLSVVVDDFLKRYDQNNKATYTKLLATLPLLVELVGDKSINQILQTDLNGFFDDVQKLPVKRKQKAFEGMTIREIIAANNGRCIAAGTFESTYKACVSIFLSWATTNYRDQGFSDTFDVIKKARFDQLGVNRNDAP